MLAGAILVLATLASGIPARAATVPTGFQEYHVIGDGVPVFEQDRVDKHLLDVYNLIGDPATIMK